MRLNSLFSTVSASAILAFALTAAQGQTTPPPTIQNTTGTAGAAYSSSNGDATTGGYTIGSGNATYGASDANLAQGAASAAGAGSGTSTVGPTSASATNNSVISNSAKAIGSLTTICLTGAAQQGDYAGTGDNNTFASAGNKSVGNFSGTDNANAPLTGSGGATATGKTSVSTTGAGTNNVNSTLSTVGSSTGATTFSTADSAAVPVVSSGVQGMGGASGQSIAGDLKDTYALGNVQGTTSYSANNPTGATATGSQSIIGATNGKITNPGSVSASSTITSTATAH